MSLYVSTNLGVCFCGIHCVWWRCWRSLVTPRTPVPPRPQWRTERWSQNSSRRSARAFLCLYEHTHTQHITIIMNVKKKHLLEQPLNSLHHAVQSKGITMRALRAYDPLVQWERFNNVIQADTWKSTPTHACLSISGLPTKPELCTMGSLSKTSRAVVIHSKGLIEESQDRDGERQQVSISGGPAVVHRRHKCLVSLWPPSG